MLAHNTLKLHKVPAKFQRPILKHSTVQDSQLVILIKIVRNFLQYNSRLRQNNHFD